MPFGVEPQVGFSGRCRAVPASVAQAIARWRAPTAFGAVSDPPLIAASGRALHRPESATSVPALGVPGSREHRRALELPTLRGRIRLQRVGSIRAGERVQLSALAVAQVSGISPIPRRHTNNARVIAFRNQ